MNIVLMICAIFSITIVVMAAICYPLVVDAKRVDEQIECLIKKMANKKKDKEDDKNEKTYI